MEKKRPKFARFFKEKNYKSPDFYNRFQYVAKNIKGLTNMGKKNAFDHIYVPKDTLNTPSFNGKAKVSSIKPSKGQLQVHDPICNLHKLYET